MGHSLLLIWGPEAQGDIVRWFQIGGLWAFIALHGSFGVIGFCLTTVRNRSSSRYSTVQRYRILGSYCCFRNSIPSIPSWTSKLVLRSKFWCSSDFPFPSFPTRFPQLDS